MKTNRRLALAAAGLSCLVASGPAWAGAGFGAGQSLDVKEFLAEARASKAPQTPVMTADSAAVKPVEFVSIGGGKFKMGAENDDHDALPVHMVAVKTFEISKTLVTVEQYAQCVDKGRCAQPGTGWSCNWGKKDRQRHPINCVGWKDADDFAKFMDARLPSEAEYEYAATSRGKIKPYPWGKEEATCERAVMVGDDVLGCGGGGTMPVCSKPAGNTEQGLCDMAGNVWQWVQDKYRRSYAADAPAFETSSRVMRGGSFFSRHPEDLRTSSRGSGEPGDRFGHIGFRVAR